MKLAEIEVVHEGWCRLLVATIRSSDGRILRREIEDHGRAACVLPYDSERRMAILARQFRAPVFFAARSEETLEAIAGIVEGVDPMECARREAFEEAGLKLASLSTSSPAGPCPASRRSVWISILRSITQPTALRREAG